MGTVQLRYETMQTDGLVEAIAAIPRYDIAVANEGQSSLEKMGLAPIQIQRAAGLSAGPRGQAERLLPKQRRGSAGLDPHLHHPLLCSRKN